MRLLDFWARRIRRLLPASALVLSVSLVLAWATSPRVVWATNFVDVRAAAAYVQNWVRARSAVDYLGAESSPGVAQHYWSLSVEEQFYLVRPLLVAAAVAWWHRGRTRGADGSVASSVAMVLGSVTVVSFGYGLWATAVSPAKAFFDTAGRAWEFGVGGMIAAFGWGKALHDIARAVLGWVSVGVLLVASW